MCTHLQQCTAFIYSVCTVFNELKLHNLVQLTVASCRRIWGTFVLSNGAVETVCIVNARQVSLKSRLA